MSGGGGSTNTIQSSTPWQPSQPYLLQGLSSAQQLAGQGGPAPWIGPTFVGQTGAQGAAQQQQLGYANSTLGGLSGLSGSDAAGALNKALSGSGSLSALTNGLGGQASSALSQQLSGQPNYSAVNGAIGAANQQQWNQLDNTLIPQLNQKASFLNNPTGSIKDLNSAVTNLTNNQSLNAQQAYLGQLNLAQQQQQSALGLYGNASQAGGSQALTAAGLFPGLAQAGQAPGQIAGSIADTGQAYQQAGLNDIMTQYGQLQQQPYQNLDWYDQLINGASGQGSSSTASQDVNSGITGHVVGAIGGGLAGGALAGSAYGPYGTLIGAALGGIFG